ncbi:MAG: DNA repair protein RecO [Rhodospirillales bacterium]
MEWDDEAVVLSARTLGESSAVLSALTRAHGRHAGLVRGGSGRRGRGLLQPGNRVFCHWRARSAEQLGTFACELITATAPSVLDDAARLAAVASACAVLDAALPEREPATAQHDGLLALLHAVEEDAAWPSVYVRWELALLADLGFGLDLSACAVTGTREGLAFVSPRTGRAVCAAAAAPWQQRLLVLPAFLAGGASAVGHDEIIAGLALTGHFLRRCIFAEQDRDLPAARRRLPEVIGRLTARDGGSRDEKA